MQGGLNLPSVTNLLAFVTLTADPRSCNLIAILTQSYKPLRTL